MFNIQFRKINLNAYTPLETYESNKDNYKVTIKEDILNYWYFIIENKLLDYMYISTFNKDEGCYDSKETCIIEAKKYLSKTIKRHNPKVSYMKLEDFKIGDKVGFIELNKTRLPLSLEKSVGEVVGFGKINVKVIVEIKTYHVPPSNLIKR